MELGFVLRELGDEIIDVISFVSGEVTVDDLDDVVGRVREGGTRVPGSFEVVEYVLSSLAEVHRLASRHEPDLVEEGPNLRRRLVDGDDNGVPKGSKAFEEFDLRESRRCVKAAGGLVKNEEGRLTEKLQSDAQSPLLAPGQALLEHGSDNGVCGVREAQVLDKIFHCIVDLLPRFPAHGQLRCEVKGFSHSQRADERLLLGYVHSMSLELVLAYGTLAIEQNLAPQLSVRAVFDSASNEIHQRCLSGTRGSHHRADLPRPHIAIQVLEDYMIFDAESDIVPLQADGLDSRQARVVFLGLSKRRYLPHSSRFLF
mmetsp:Transcript_8636/g.16376  ORF Transcript_8636/g.16376 Transcript_8636/m.16376 type:complete len:314 (-) Transcript_8636:124-1065(-)